MSINSNQARALLHRFRFEELFINELGWDRYRSTLAVTMSIIPVELHAIAQKRGMVAYHCPTAAGQALPSYGERRKIEHQVSKSTHEHFIIFTDAANTTQIWQWVRREPGRPTACREHSFHVSQSGDSLIQKLEAIAFTLDEEEALSLTDVTGRARAGFDVEQVTRRFYDHFQKEHAVFLKFISGISEVADREWYASVMLNRLMFIYFIQKKGFLDGDRDYLRNRLNTLQEKHGRDKFYSFYRYFLLRLFHEGLGSRKRSAELEKLLGRIPYLNGGIFDVHKLEKPEHYGRAIEIPDEAFERIFDYFDLYQWHLDERPLRADNEINPDVLGYIFEKYINQKQMGAYYTKEDITEYITKHTVLPFLFDTAQSGCTIAFENPHGPTIWTLLSADPDRYIYDSIQKGADQPLPAEIALGVDSTIRDLSARRTNWNKAAAAELGLPTEIWREVVARRRYRDDVRERLASGRVHTINDFITLNLDIRQFAQDIIENSEGPDLLRAFWNAITHVTILDPTCGSGAFLFAALNILEPLYEACLERMEAFVSDVDRLSDEGRGEKFADFRRTLKEVGRHPNRRYFIFKTIILKNLFGVDIMEEAVEICKLRLFLKLAAQVERNLAHENLGIEPLPDIDFNIRAGNALVGYANYNAVRRAMTSTLDLANVAEEIAGKAGVLQKVFDAFRNEQIDSDGATASQQKQELTAKLEALEVELNRHLAGEYGIQPKDKNKYNKWIKSHEPFHWFIEFYGIVERGGFDIIIGNPPFVEYSKVEERYRVTGFSTLPTNNLFALVAERSRELLGDDGRIGLILPNSSVSASKMRPVQHALRAAATCWISNYAWRPSKLFEGANMLLAIWLVAAGHDQRCYSTRYNRWSAEFRPHLFESLRYLEVTALLQDSRIPKLPSLLAASVLEKCRASAGARTLYESVTNGRYKLYYFRAVLYWFKVLVAPPIREENGVQTPTGEMKELRFDTKPERDAALCIMASNLFALHYVVWSSCQVVNSPDLMFPVNIEKLVAKCGDRLSELADALMKDVQRQSKVQTRQYSARGRTFTMRKQYFYFKNSKNIINEIDRALAAFYGFSEEELDFIVNYDVKFRLSREEEAEDD